MWSGLLPAARYALGWSRNRAPVHERDVEVDVDGVQVPGSLFVPRASRTPLTGWVLLHGITRPGRKHPTLERFARALAATPAVVLVPDIPSWRALELDPDRSVPTIQAAVLALSRRPETAPDRIGLIGFSFGSPQALVASTDSRLRGKLKAVVGFGGYYDLTRTLRFLFTGRHEWEGVTYRSRPDPYGRWVVGANYLVGAAGYEACGDVAGALRRLAEDAGERRVDSWDPVYDELKDRLEKDIHPDRRALYRLFAPGPDEPPVDEERGKNMADALAASARHASALLDPAPHLERVRVPIRLFHGRQDHLIPFTETLRTKAALAAEHDVRARVTGLFAHSTEADRGSPLATAREHASLLLGLSDVFRLL